MREADVLEIKKKWDAGVSMRQIIRTMPYKKHITARCIWELQNQGVLQERGRKNGMEAVVDTYKSGIHNPYEIAEMHGYTVSTVRTYLSKAKLGRPLHENGKNWVKRECDERTLEILASLESGVGVNETARRFGVSKQWVSFVKRRSEKENG